MADTTGPVHPPSLDDIAELADAVWRNLPERFRRPAADIVFRVEEFPDDETEREMRLESPFDLLGLYRGAPLSERGQSETRQDLDAIFLYRRGILDYWCETGEDLAHIVRHVLVHEIGHHFGLSDADMEAIEAGAEPHGADVR